VTEPSLDSGDVKIRRAYRGVYLAGHRRYLTVKWLRTGVRAIRAGLWQWQAGRLLVRLSRTLAARQCCPRTRRLGRWDVCGPCAVREGWD
jgi:hypothetical protein